MIWEGGWGIRLVWNFCMELLGWFCLGRMDGFFGGFWMGWRGRDMGMENSILLDGIFIFLFYV